METIASELSAASEEKAAEAEKLQSEADSYKVSLGSNFPLRDFFLHVGFG